MPLGQSDLFEESELAVFGNTCSSKETRVPPETGTLRILCSLSCVKHPTPVYVKNLLQLDKHCLMETTLKKNEIPKSFSESPVLQPLLPLPCTR